MNYEELTPMSASGYAGFMPEDSPEIVDTGNQPERSSPLSPEEIGKMVEQRTAERIQERLETTERTKHVKENQRPEDIKKVIEDIDANLKLITQQAEEGVGDQMQLQKDMLGLTAQKNRLQRQLEGKTARIDLEGNEKALKEYNFAELEDLEKRYETTEDQVEKKQLADKIGKEKAKFDKEVSGITAIANATKARLTGSDGKTILNPQFESEWKHMRKLIEKLRSNIRMNADVKADALELARLIKPFYLAEKPQIQEDFYWVPKNAEDLWLHIAKSQPEEFSVGGQYALVSVKDNPDAPNGKEVTLNTENIFEWLRGEILRVHEFNSTAPSELLGNMISIRAGFTQFGIFELLWQKNYWLREVKTADGGTTEIGDKFYSALQDQLFMELWKYYFIHDSAVAYREGMGSEDELVKALSNFYNRKNLFTATRGRLRDNFCYGSTDKENHGGKDGKGEILYKLSNNADGERYQGTLGKAAQRLKVAYGYMAESVMVQGSQQHFRLQKTDEKGNPLKKQDGRPDMYENLFEKALGEKGSEEFYRAIIRDVFATEYGGTFALGEEVIKNLNMGRRDWQQVDLLDLLFKGEAEFIGQLEKTTPRIAASYEETMNEIEKEWTEKGKGEEFRVQKEILKKGKKAILEALAKKGKFGIRLEGNDFVGDFAAQMHNFAVSKDDHDMRGFAVELARQVWIKDDENILNVFSHPKKGQVTQRVRNAMVGAMVKQHNLRVNEVKYGEGFVFDLAFLMGDAAANDVDGIGFNAWSKWMNTGRYREGQTDFKNAFGNPANIPGIRKLSGTFAQFTKVRGENENDFEKSLQSFLQGGEGDSIDLEKELPVFDFRENASAQFHADHISMVAKFYKSLNTIEVEFGKLIKYDPRTGASIKDFEAFQQFIDNYWKPLRYAEGNADPPLKEKFRSWTYRGKLGLNYKIKRTATVRTAALQDLMVSKDVVGLEMPDFPSNILAYLIGAQIALHLPPLCYRFGYKKYGLEQVEQLHDLFSKASRSSLFEGQDISLILPAIADDQWKRLLKIAKTRWLKLYFSAYGWDTGGLAKDLVTSIFEQFLKSIAFIGNK